MGPPKIWSPKDDLIMYPVLFVDSIFGKFPCIIYFLFVDFLSYANENTSAI